MHIMPFPPSLSLLSLCCLPAFPMLPAACLARLAAVAAKAVWEHDSLSADGIAVLKRANEGGAAWREGYRGLDGRRWLNELSLAIKSYKGEEIASVLSLYALPP